MMVGPVHEVIAAASQLATTAVAAALWQGLLLSGAAALGLRLLPETPAPVRFAIWFAVFVLVAGLPFATVLFSHGGAATASAAVTHPWFTLDARWCLWIGAVWALASLVRGITLVAAGFRVRALWKRAQPVELALPQGLARGAQVCVSDEVDRPTVIGFFSPKIVIPDWLIAKLSPEELEQVVLHEAGHLSRRDDWLNLLQKLALVLFPLNPALSWVERRLCFERELACDERVLRATGAPKAYAECLATLAEYRLERRGLVRELALALGALGRESELAKRVLRILSGGGRMKRSHARLVFGGSMLTLVFAATAMEHSPQLVGFTHPVATPSHPALAGAGVRPIAVRASVSPAEQWKTIGDAAPHTAKPAVRSYRPMRADDAPAKASLVAAPVNASPSAGAEAVPVSKIDSAALRGDAPYAPEVVQTVATTRQVTADGHVLVTRMVTVRAYNVTSPDASRSISDVPEPGSQHQPQKVQQPQVRPYAAVPVQGGWIVFQL